MYRQRTNTSCPCYGLLRTVPGVSDGSVFYQGPCPDKGASRGGICVCGCNCEMPLEPCPRYAPVCFDADCLAEVTASAPDDDSCGCGCGNGCGCGCGNGCGCGCGNGCGNGCGCGCGNGCGNCGCNGCGDCCCNGGSQPPATPNYYAVLTAPGPATLADGGTLNFGIAQGGGTGFAPCTGGVQVLQDGTYFVTYTLNAPPLSQADTVLGLRLNGARLPESETAVQLNGAGGAACFGGQTVVTAAAGSCLSLVGNGTATFPQATSGAPLATMTIVRVSP